MARVLLVDDHTVVREGLRSMLLSDPSIVVVGEAASGEEGIDQAFTLAPDVVLMDIQLPGISGIEATRRIKAAQPGTAVVFLTMYNSEMYVVEGLRAGAAGYLVKDSSRELLCHAIHAVLDGCVMIKSTLLRRATQGPSRVSQQPGEGQGGFGVMESLTNRELEVLHLVAQGYPNKQIAAELHLAEVTVKKHVQSVMGKLGASDRTQAAIMAVRLGLAE